jgi:hypothetical protein
MYGLMMSAREFSLDEPEEDMVALKLKTAPDRNKSKQKHVTTQDFIKFWGKIFAFVLLEMFGNSQGFKTF